MKTCYFHWESLKIIPKCYTPQGCLVHMTDKFSYFIYSSLCFCECLTTCIPAPMGKENLISIFIANKTQFNFSVTVIKQSSTSMTAVPKQVFTPVVPVLYSSIWEVFRWLLVLIIKDFLSALGPVPAFRLLFLKPQTHTCINLIFSARHTPPSLPRGEGMEGAHMQFLSSPGKGVYELHNPNPHHALFSKM